MTVRASEVGLVDSNILIYSVDPRDLIKQRRAITVLDQLMAAARMALSAQCLSEFYRVTTQRLPDRVAPAIAAAHVEYWATACKVFDLTGPIVLEGCRRSAASQIAVWDGLIWAVAKANGISLVLTEDIPGRRTATGQVAIDGVRYINPLASEFQLSDLL